MIAIILKIILCSSFLIGFYYLFLEKERTFKFNRIFLLIALVFSYTIPFVKFKIPFEQKSTAQLIFGESVQEFQTVNHTTTQLFNNEQIILMIYVIVSMFLLIKFIYSFAKIKFLKGETRIYKNHKVLILDRVVVPFSFINTIFLGRNHLINNEIEERIFLHEKCHIDEKHSFDILFLEILKIFSWFNPALFLYKKAMITNHEFLADDSVLQHNFEIQNYQHLILNEIRISQNYKLTHQFNFNNTKKRFIMMTTKNSKFAGIKKFALLPVLAILFVLFSNKIDAKIEIKTDSEPSPIRSEKQDATISIDELNAKLGEKQSTLDSNELIAEHPLKQDTIKKKQSQDLAVPTTPPPPPGKFEQVPAEFPGGVNALRSLVANAFDTSIFKGDEGLLKTTVYLSIDESGKISNIFAEGENQKFNAEAVRALKVSNADKVWKPATEDSNPVKTVYKLPLTMQFEGPAVKK